jgi:hypothetical protein
MRHVGEVLVALSLLTIGSMPALMKSCGGGGMGHYEARMDSNGGGMGDGDRGAHTLNRASARKDAPLLAVVALQGILYPPSVSRAPG